MSIEGSSAAFTVTAQEIQKVTIIPVSKTTLNKKYFDRRVKMRRVHF